MQIHRDTGEPCDTAPLSSLGSLAADRSEREKKNREPKWGVPDGARLSDRLGGREKRNAFEFGVHSKFGRTN